MNQLQIEWFLNFCPQITNVDIHGIGSTGKIIAPDILQECFTADHDIFIDQKLLQQVKLSLGQIKQGITDFDLTRLRIQTQRAG